MYSRKEELVLLVLTVFTLLGFSLSGQSMEQPVCSGFINAPTAFKSSVNVASIDFTWTTYAEKDNDYFAIQRSEDAIIWETVVMVPGKGDFSMIQDYQATDSSPLYGESLYRIKQTSLDGSVMYSVTHTVNFSNSPNVTAALEVYPNPSQGTFNLSVVAVIDTPEAVLHIIDLGGRVVSEKLLSIAQLRFTLETNLSPGLYTVVLFTDQGLAACEELVVH